MISKKTLDKAKQDASPEVKVKEIRGIKLLPKEAPKETDY